MWPEDGRVPVQGGVQSLVSPAAGAELLCPWPRVVRPGHRSITADTRPHTATLSTTRLDSDVPSDVRL